jgi:hypothetical protein
MTHPDILAALAGERVNTFLGEAQADRLASLARAARSPARRKHAVLHDGSQEAVLVIPPGDPGYDQMPQPVSQPC